jgi:SWI/SNF-related matrix-associated actin-dependent regulator 1 of chromatin subfamily A
MKLWNTCFFRRDKSLVLKDLPEKMRQYIPVDISNRKEYSLAEGNLVKFLKEYARLSNKKIKKSMRGEMMVRVSYLRRLSALGKMRVAIPFIHDVIDGGQNSLSRIPQGVVVSG